jgi:hypothetical protein
MASTLLNAVFQASIYQINSNNVINRSLFPYGMPMMFGTANSVFQANSFSSLNDLQAGRQPGGALIYTAITNSAYGPTVFYTDKTIAAIVTQLAT